MPPSLPTLPPRASAPALRGLLYTGLGLTLAGALVAGCVKSGEPPARAVNAYAMGVAAYDRGDTSTAKQKLIAATQAAPELVNARSLLGDIFRQEGDYKAALSQYEAVVKLDPYSPSSFYKLGVAYQFLDRLVESRDAYLKTLKLSPNDAEAHMNLGLVYLALGELPSAVEETKKAVELSPEGAKARGPALANYGVVLDAVGDGPGAERAFLSSLEITGDSPATLLNLGQNLLTQNRGKEAQQVFERLVSKQDSSLARKRLGDAFALQGMAVEAIEQYEKALKIDPRYYPAMNDAGRVMIARYRAGLELDESLRAVAVSYWKKSLAINPNQPQTKALVAQWSK